MDLRLPQPLSFEGNVAENFRRFKQSFEIYLLASDKDSKEEKVKVALLLNLMGEEGLEVYNTLKLTEEQKRNHKEILNELEKFMSPKKNIVYERFLFYSRKQEENELFDHFLTDLKKLSKTCEFGDSDIVDSMIRDRVVLGIRSRELQERLLHVDNLNLNKAIELCRSNEVTKAHVKEVQGEQESRIDVVKSKMGHKGEEKTKENYRKTESGYKLGLDTKLIECKNCGNRHEYRKCPAYGRRCNKCKRFGHFEKVCRKQYVQEMQETKKDKEDSDEVLITTIKVNEVKNSNEWFEKLIVNNKTVEFKIDTGSQVNVIPKNVWSQIQLTDSLTNRSKIILETYGGFKIKPIGTVNVSCMFKKQVHNLKFVVVNENTVPLLGLESCCKLGIVSKVAAVSLNGSEDFVKKNIDVFTGLGLFKKKCTLKVKKNTVPVARPPRRVPLAIKPRLKAKLEELVGKGVISEYEGPTDWLSNLVIIDKNDKSLRLCLDPKELNKCLEREYCEIPTLEDISAKLSNKCYFTVLDFKEGFYQVGLDEESSKMCAFGCPFGVYKFNRLPFGLNCSPEFFQKLNNDNFGDIPGVIVYFDDLLIAAENIQKHDDILKQVIERARDINVKFNPMKIQYRVQEVKYLGHIFDKYGMRPDDEKIEAIIKLKEPKCKKELQRLLGMINYHSKYIPNLSKISAPLRELLQKDNAYLWTTRQSDSLNMIKKLISTPPVLSNFDETKSIIIQTDASQNGLGCVLLQEGKPVAFASRSLTDCETRFSQIEKEFLAIYYACTKFHNFVYGRPVTVHSDHKPIESIMKKGIAEVHSPRLQRIKIKLLKYDLNVCYKPGKEMLIADLLSRNYLQGVSKDETFFNEVVHTINMTETRQEEFREESEKDHELIKLKEFCIRGWPKDGTKVPDIIKKLCQKQK